MSDTDSRLPAAITAVDEAVTAEHLSPETAANLKRWLTGEAYSEYHPALVDAIDGGEWERLTNAYWEVIPFGTGGRRGTMGDFGTATVNRRTIAESADGLARYFLSTLDSGSGKKTGKAVIAHDTRNRSPEFAELTATTLAAHGLHVYLFDGHRSTPELSFAIRHLGCDVGVVISASHNPPADNGFKAYWSSGGQVLSPHDAGIIRMVESAGTIPAMTLDEAKAAGRITVIGEEIDRAYQDALLALSLSDDKSASAVYTSLHGAGDTSVLPVLERAGFANCHHLQSQAAADGNFPTVDKQFPNPERPEVYEPAIEKARELDADLVLASDPDADRIGVIAKDGSGEYVRISGNQIGALLTDYILRKRAPISSEQYVVETLVTTPLIGAIGHAAGATVIDDLLVGFKYIGQTMDERGPEHFLFGAEESLGYLAGDYARDKDAAIAALYVMELASELKSEGRTLHDRLAELWSEHGYHVEGQTSEVCPGPRGKEQIVGLMQRFRTAPPTELGGLSLASVRDYAEHEVRSIPDGKRIGDLPAPSGSLLFFDTGAGVSPHLSIAVRPSGTEPKIKFYYFLQSAVEGGSLDEVRSETDALFEQIKTSLSGWIAEQLKTL